MFRHVSPLGRLEPGDRSPGAELRAVAVLPQFFQRTPGLLLSLLQILLLGQQATRLRLPVNEPLNFPASYTNKATVNYKKKHTGSKKT